MPLLDAYIWEHNKFPAERNIEIPYPERLHLTQIIAQKFNLPHIGVVCNLNNSGGKAHTGSMLYIRLPKAQYPCCLGTIYHEVAHILNHCQFKGRGHRGTFKRALIKVYCEARQFIDKARAEALALIIKEKTELEQKSQAYQRKLARLHALKTMRQTPEYKAEQLRKRIKSLETRAKRINTLLKSAKRSLAVRERHLAKKTMAVVG